MERFKNTQIRTQVQKGMYINMDPNQYLSAGWNVYNNLPTTTQELLLNPSAKTIGSALDSAVTVFCAPLLLLGAVSKPLIKKFANEIEHKINAIPEENRDVSQTGLLIKALEDARYQLNKNAIRKLYVNLIASTLDNRKNESIGPRYGTVIAQFSKKDAVFLEKLYKNEPLPYVRTRLKLDDNGVGYTLPQRLAVADNDEIINNFDASLDVLNSLGIAFDHRTSSITTYTQRYELGEKIQKQIFSDKITNAPKGSEAERSYITLTTFGKNLCYYIFE